MKVQIAAVLVLLTIFTSCNWLASAKPTALSEGFSPTFTMVVAEHTAASVTATPTAISIPSPSFEPSQPNLPAWEWPRSTLEEQGLSSNELAAMLEAIRQENRPIHSMLVIRHGFLVMEAYAHPFNGETRHGVYSVTKSVTSILTGIARMEGLLGTVDTPVVTYFSDVTLDDPRKQSITMENLLAMNSGIEWTEPLYSGLSDYWGIIETDNPAQYFFSPALIEEPGTVFNYNSGGSHMLSMMVQAVAGEQAVDFAAQKLFPQLDIRDFYWQEDFTGHSLGGSGLELLPLDMAKIGLMYLNGGQWQGVQVVPADWVSESTRVHSNPSTDLGYGYQWWIRPQGDFYALGWGGQQIHVFPEQDMVVVFTAGMSGEGMLHEDLIDQYLLPAVLSDGDLPADTQGQARLETAIHTLASPQTWPSYPLSPLASEVDGKEWLITGRGNWSMFTLHFTNNTEAQIDLTLDGDAVPLAIGLDGIFRVTNTKDLGPVALVGYWESEDTFALVQQNLREADRRLTHIQFDGETVRLWSEWFVEPYQEESEGVLFGN